MLYFSLKFVEAGFWGLNLILYLITSLSLETLKSSLCLDAHYSDWVEGSAFKFFFFLYLISGSSLSSPFWRHFVSLWGFLVMALLSALLEILRRPTMLDVLSELMLFITPLWLAIIVGLLVGWVWKPKWAKNLTNCSMSKNASPASPTTSVSACFASFPCLNALKFQLPNSVSCFRDDKESPSVPPAATESDSRFVGFCYFI